MSGQHQTIWEILGIEPTRDKKLIRRAYAKKCRECHPEDHPEEFRLLRQAYERALNGPEFPVIEPWGKLLGDGEDNPALESAPSPKSQENLPETIPEEEPASASVLSLERWEELLARGMEDDSAFPSLPNPLSWQQTNRTQFSSAALTESEELLEQMKRLEAFSKDNPPQEDSDWQNLMESWDLLADSRLFRQIGERPCYFQMLFSWLNEERGRIHLPTIIGLLRIYKINERIIGHPWKARKFERKIPALRRLTYEFIFYQSIWDEKMFQEKFDKYKDRKTKRFADKLKREQKKDKTASWQIPGGSVFSWMAEHRLLWKVLCVVLIFLFRYAANIGK